MASQSKIKLKRIPANSISLAGEFAVLSQLVLRGYDANMTLGHTKNVDILISDPATGKMIRLEVKTSLKEKEDKPHQSKLFGRYVSDWIMGAKHEKIFAHNLFYCFVTITNPGNSFRFYIIPSKTVADYIKMEHQYWLQNTKTGKESTMRLFRIGFKDEKYFVPTPSIERYENNWRFRK